MATQEDFSNVVAFNRKKKSTHNIHVSQNYFLFFSPCPENGGTFAQNAWVDLHNPSGESACTSDVTCSGKFKDLSSGAPVDTTSWTDMDFAEVSKASPSKLCLRLKRSSVLGVVGVDCDASLEYPICQYECGGERKMTTASHNTCSQQVVPCRPWLRLLFLLTYYALFLLLLMPVLLYCSYWK